MGVQSMRDLMRRESPVQIYELEQYFERMLTGAVCLLEGEGSTRPRKATACKGWLSRGDEDGDECDLPKGHTGRHRVVYDNDIHIEWGQGA